MFESVPLETEVVARQIIGAAIEVHRTLGPGFLETIYQHARSISTLFASNWMLAGSDSNASGPSPCTIVAAQFLLLNFNCPTLEDGIKRFVL